jgi:hypothetical protein
MFSVNSFAKGVSAGTVISNIATLTFELDDEKNSIVSNRVEDIVAQLIDVDVSSVESRYIDVKNGDKNKIITFKITNTGNGEDYFYISCDQDNRSNFNVKNKTIYLDANQNNKFDLDDEIIETLKLKEDENKILFIASDIFIDKVESENLMSFVSLKAVSKLGGSNESGKVHIGKGVNGVDAIDGLNGGVGVDSWGYIVKSSDVFLSKDSTLSSNSLDEKIVTYEINVTLSENKIVDDLVVEDKIPKFCIYKQGSLRVNDKKISDAKDSDIGWFDKVNNKVVINLGTQSYPSCKKIKFKVKVGEKL